jgi:Leucine-rich repeat (LRR) protein
MKSGYYLPVLFLSMLALAAPVEPGTCSDPVSIPDANLRAGISDYLQANHGTSEITCGSLALVTRLELIEQGVADIEGLQYCENLEHLNLTRNPIANIDALGWHANLVSLDVTRTDVTAFPPLPALEQVACQNGEFSTLATLVHSPGVRIIDARNNSINDISVISNLLNLQSLLIDGNNISSLSPVANHPSLSYLGASRNPITSVPELGFTDLSVFQCDACNLSRISGLAGQANLWEVRLANNRIVLLGPIANVPSLQRLDISGNRIKDIAVLVNHPHFGQYGNELFVANNCLTLEEGTADQDNIDHLRMLGVVVDEIPQRDDCVNPNPHPIGGFQKPKFNR